MEKKQNKSDMSKKIKPLADRVLIKEEDEKKGGETKSGIFIPETVGKDNSTHRGEVLAVGEGKYDDGKLIPVSVSVGDTVLFQWGDKLTIDDEEYWVVGESNILAIIK